MSAAEKHRKWHRNRQTRPRQREAMLDLAPPGTVSLQRLFEILKGRKTSSGCVGSRPYLGTLGRATHSHSFGTPRRALRRPQTAPK